MDKIINYLLLTIIFVFDPLAIALVVAANFAFEQLKPKKEILEETLIVKTDLPIEEKPIEEKQETALEVYGDDKAKLLKLKIEKLKDIQNSSSTLSSKRWTRIQEELAKAQKELDSLPKSDSPDQINYF